MNMSFNTDNLNTSTSDFPIHSQIIPIRHGFVKAGASGNGFERRSQATQIFETNCVTTVPKLHKYLKRPESFSVMDRLGCMNSDVKVP